MRVGGETFRLHGMLIVVDYAIMLIMLIMLIISIFERN